MGQTSKVRASRSLFVPTYPVLVEPRSWRGASPIDSRRTRQTAPGRRARGAEVLRRALGTCDCPSSSGGGRGDDRLSMRLRPSHTACRPLWNLPDPQL